MELLNNRDFDINSREFSIIFEKSDLKISNLFNLYNQTAFIESEDIGNNENKSSSIIKKIKNAIIHLCREIKKFFTNAFSDLGKSELTSDMYMNSNQGMQEFDTDYKKVIQAVDADYLESHKIMKMINKISGASASEIQDIRNKINNLGEKAAGFIDAHGNVILKTAATVVLTNMAAKTAKDMLNLNDQIEQEASNCEDDNSDDSKNKLSLLQLLLRKTKTSLSTCLSIAHDVTNSVNLASRTAAKNVSRQNKREAKRAKNANNK